MKHLFFLMAFSMIGWSHELQIKVDLNPAGAFTAKSSDLKIVGELKKTPVGFAAKKILLSVASLKTGIDLRDNHMKKKYFEVEKFPVATLIEGGGQGGKFQGKLEVHGVIHPIAGTYQLNGPDLEAEFPCKLSDFKIPEANYMGVGVEDEVKVVVKLRIP